MDERWLHGILACGLAVEAGAICAVLEERGLRCRSVPSGQAITAWTCATDRGTVGVVVSGRGLAAARHAAEYWMPKAPTVLVVGAGMPTRSADGPRIALDGDDQLAAAVASAAWRLSVNVVAGRVATVSVEPITESALVSLAGAGYAAVDAESTAWRESATSLGATMASCRGLLSTDAADFALAALPPRTRAARSPWLEPWRRLAPHRRALLHRGDAALASAARTAARCAVAALIGS